jgi:HAD superfamily hydrolase (TIGR01509 family)
MDGVLFDSKLNMKLAWSDVELKFKIKKNFNEYFKNIGLPFKNILKKINIKKNLDEIEKYYQKSSLKYFKKIKPYPGVLKTLKKLSKKNIALGIFTSKHRLRTLKLLKKFDLKFQPIITPLKGIRGKPFPDQINKTLKKFKISKKNVIYVGDMYVDYLVAKRSGIKFIYADYGYGKKITNTSKKITSFKQIEKLIS